MSREAPYNRLKRVAREALEKQIHRRRKVMWRYPKGRLSEGWNLATLAERVQAADQLGWDVQLRVTDGELVVEYVKRAPTNELPWELRYR